MRWLSWWKPNQPLIEPAQMGKGTHSITRVMIAAAGKYFSQQQLANNLFAFPVRCSAVLFQTDVLRLAQPQKKIKWLLNEPSTSWQFLAVTYGQVSEGVERCADTKASKIAVINLNKWPPLLSLSHCAESWSCWFGFSWAGLHWNKAQFMHSAHSHVQLILTLFM